MICTCCQKKEANKTNTHYLTDAIIRKSFNPIGTKERDKGILFNFSNDRPELEATIQRETPIKNIEELFGRDLTDDEIEDHSRKKFSVDYVFCGECESKFTEIENDFTARILPDFRDGDLSKINSLD